MGNEHSVKHDELLIILEKIFPKKKNVYQIENPSQLDEYMKLRAVSTTFKDIIENLKWKVGPILNYPTTDKLFGSTIKFPNFELKMKNDFIRIKENDKNHFKKWLHYPKLLVYFDEGESITVLDINITFGKNLLPGWYFIEQNLDDFVHLNMYHFEKSSIAPNNVEFWTLNWMTRNFKIKPYLVKNKINNYINMKNIKLKFENIGIPLFAIENKNKGFALYKQKNDSLYSGILICDKARESDYLQANDFCVNLNFPVEDDDYFLIQQTFDYYWTLPEYQRIMQAFTDIPIYLSEGSDGYKNFIEFDFDYYHDYFNPDSEDDYWESDSEDDDLESDSKDDDSESDSESD
jgi:hypothetical protein